MTKAPAHLVAFAVAIVVVIATAVVVCTGHPVPAWFELVALAAVAGGAGVAVPPQLSSVLETLVDAVTSVNAPPRNLPQSPNTPAVIPPMVVPAPVITAAAAVPVAAPPAGT